MLRPKGREEPEWPQITTGHKWGISPRGQVGLGEGSDRLDPHLVGFGWGATMGSLPTPPRGTQLVPIFAT